MSKNKGKIPQIRQRLRELSTELGVPELEDLADQLYRSSAVKRARIKSPPLTPELAAQIRAYADAHPDLHQQDIANHFGVNHGRVSEALNNLV